MSTIEETEEYIQAWGSFNSSKCTKQAKRNYSHQFSKMSNMRVIQKQLVYVIGLSSNLAFKDTQLSRFEYFGQYGRITKLVVNKNKVYNMNGPNGPSYSAYITYSTAEECSLAILALDNAIVDNHLLRASYGTTKYCANFLRGVECFNRECLYLHYLADEEDILDRDDMNSNKSIFTSQHHLAMNIADIFNYEKRKKFLAMRANKTILPSPHFIYEKEIVIEQFKKRREELSAAMCSYNNDKSFMSLMSKTNKLYKAKEKSRFDFASSFSSDDEPIEIPSFVPYLIAKKYSRYSFFKKFVEEGEDFTYFDKTLIKEYNELNPWARFIICSNNDKKVKVFIEKLAEEEEIKFLRRYKSA